MTTQDKPGRGDRRAIMWLGHYSVFVLWGGIALFIANDAVGQPSARPWFWIVTVVSVVWIGSLFADGYHEDRLCERCIAASPLDPAAAVQRWRPALWWTHQKRLSLIVMLAALSVFVCNALFHHPPWWLSALSILAFLVLGISFAVTYQHRRLYPWCPYCHWDDGGDEEISPGVPAPTMAR